MAFELLGMTGYILYAFIIAAILLANWKLSKKEFLKFMPVSRQGLGVLGILIMIGVGSSTAWWGYGELALPGAADEPAVTPGVTFEAEGSEGDENVSYDQASGVFTISYYENGTSSITATGSEKSDYGTSTFTITVFRTDLATITTENATSKIWATVPTFYGKNENSSTLYWPIDKDDTSQKYEIAFTPSGGSARDGYNYFTVGAGGSKAISITVDPYVIGLCQLDNFQNKDVTIHIHGLDQTFTLRYVKIGEV